MSSCILSSGFCSFRWEISHESYWRPLYVINLFSLTAFKIFFWQFDHMSGSGSLWVYPTWSLLSIMEINTDIFHLIGKVFGHDIFKYSASLSLYFSSGTSVMYMLEYLWFLRDLRSCSASFFFSFCYLDWIISVQIYWFFWKVRFV